jgi:hypothetical protein
MLLDSPADPGLLAWQVEVVAAKVGAEAAADANAASLLAELEAEDRGGGSAGQSKSQKKKEKQRRRKEAAAAAAAAAAGADGIPKLEPEPEPQVEMASVVVDQPTAAAAGAVGAGTATADALYTVSDTGDLAEMARLLDGGAEPDALVAARNDDGTHVYQSTALIAAANRGQLDAVRLLLDRGADPSLADSDGDTPLMTAAGSGQAGVVRELAARRADLDAAHPLTGFTAFHGACGVNQPECAAALVELGCDTAIRDKYGRTGKQMAENLDHAVVLDVLRVATGQRRELKAERAAAAQREEVGRLIARQAFGAAGPLLARMIQDSPSDPGLLTWKAEVAAAQVEAEAAADANAAALLAELETEGRGGGTVGQSKSQKKKEKQRRRKEAAAASTAAAAAAVDGVPQLEPEPELQVEMAADVDEGELLSPLDAQPAAPPFAQSDGKRRKKKNNKKKCPRPRLAAGPLDIIEPGEPKQVAPAYAPDLAVTVGLGRVVTL